MSSPTKVPKIDPTLKQELDRYEDELMTSQLYYLLEQFGIINVGDQ